MPIFVAPIAGALPDRVSGGRIMAAGLLLQASGLAWIAAVSTPAVPYSDLVVPFILSGTGMALFFAPVANVVLSAVRPHEQGQASGANNAIREFAASSASRCSPRSSPATAGITRIRRSCMA